MLAPSVAPQPAAVGQRGCRPGPAPTRRPGLRTALPLPGGLAAAPRFQWTGGRRIQLEKAVPPAVVRALETRGHEIEVVEDSVDMGRGEIIWQQENGVLAGAAEPRCDGTVACW